MHYLTAGSHELRTGAAVTANCPDEKTGREAQRLPGGAQLGSKGPKGSRSFRQQYQTQLMEELTV